MLPSSQPLIISGSRWRASIPLLAGLPIMFLCLCFTGSVFYLKTLFGFQLNAVIWCLWPLLVLVSLCGLFSWRVGPIFNPARLEISRFGVELFEGARSFQLRWDELGEPAIRAIRGQSFLVFGQSYSPGGVLDPALPRIGSMFELPLPRIATELAKHRPVDIVKNTPKNFGGKYPDNDAPIYVMPAFFVMMLSFASAPAFLYWASFY
jgi:hypothetical protein